MMEDWDDLDPRSRYIFEQLAQGKSREEIAQSLGYKDIEGMNQYLRRRHFVWNADLNTYEMSPKHPRYAENPYRRPIPARAAQVIAQFRQVTADPKQIARRLNFTDHREMAQYMRECGFVWDSERHNYVLDDKDAKTRDNESSDGRITKEQDEFVGVAGAGVIQPHVNWEKYIPILEILYANQDKLTTLLNGTLSSTAVVPRYPVTGGYGIKSISMATGLDQLVKDFSREKNIPQRQIFEVALVDFFKRYGYGKEVDLLLSH
jgi:hypothetical protein